MTALDITYQSQRLRLRNVVTTTANGIFARYLRDRDRFLELVLPVVLGGQRQTVALVGAYMTAATRAATGSATAKGLDPANYTIERLRGVSAQEVYGRPFGTLAAKITAGEEFATAVGAATAYLAKTVATDLQLAQTYSAYDWMRTDKRVVGYRRVLGPGKNCDLCRQASTRTYRRDDLAAIHEHCSCGVAPLFNAAEVGSLGTTVKTVVDPELGPRLVADTWDSAVELPRMPGASEAVRRAAQEERWQTYLRTHREID